MSPLVKETVKVAAETTFGITEKDHISYMPASAQLRTKLRRGECEIVDPSDPKLVTAKQLASMAEAHPEEFATAAVERGLQDLLGPVARAHLGMDLEDEGEVSRFEQFSDTKLRMLCDVYDIAVPPRATREQLIENLEAGLRDEAEADEDAPLTLSELKKMKKADLVALATEWALDISDGPTHGVLVERIWAAYQDEDEDEDEGDDEGDGETSPGDDED